MNVLKRGLVLTFTLFLTTIIAHAQQVKFERSNFPGKEAELANALRNIAQGEDLFFEAETRLTGKGLDLRYAVEVKKTVTEALAHFQQANNFNPSSAPLNLMIGKCYLYLEESVRALEFFQRAKSLDEQIRDVDFLVGWCYQEMGDVDKAIAAYDQAMKRSTSLVTVNTITTKLKECRYAQSMMNDAMDIPVDNLAVLSTPGADFLPIVMEKDEVLFFERYTDEGSRIYMSTRSADGWGEAVPTGQTINIRASEVLSEVTLLSPDEKPVTKKWFALNDDPRHTSTRFLTVAAISSDGETAYFSSNRHSGFGGFDIYSTRKNRKGEWERPRNMGDAVNTPGDEYGVAISPDGETLYFSSNGFPSMGGYDIFKSTFDGKRWGKAENLGYPVNSMANDVLNSVSADGNRLYFSSIRNGGKGDHDIYVVNYVPGVMPPMTTPSQPDIALTADAETEAPAAPSVETEVPVSTAPEVSLRPVDMAISQGSVPKIEDMPVVKKPEVKQLASLRGVVTDNDSYQPVDVALMLTDMNSSALENIQTDGQGVFQTTLTAGNTYKLTVEKEGYKPYAEEFTVDATGADLKLSKYIKLEPVAPKVTEVAVAEPVAVDPLPVIVEDEEEYEDVLVLSPLIAAADQTVEKAAELKNEYPVQYTGLLSNNRTFQPVASATIKITNKNTGDETTVRSNAQGLYNFTVASGNSYTMDIAAPGYGSFKEGLVIPVKADAVIKHSIQLTSLVDEELPDRAAMLAKVHSAPLVGGVTDSRNNPLVNVALRFTDTTTHTTVLSATDANGEYSVVLPAGSQYRVTVAGVGYEEVNDNVVMPMEPSLRASKDFRLTALVPPGVEPVKEEEPEVTTVAEATPVEPVAPVEEEPAPVVAEPVQPEPVVEEPQPVVAEPVQPEPEPVVEEPQPVVEVVPEPEQEPVKEEPKSVVQPAVERTPSANNIVLAGKITGKDKQPVKATITFTDVNRGLVEMMTTENDGAFRKVVQKGYDYSITVKADGYRNWIGDIPSFVGNKEVTVPVDLKPAEEKLLATVPFDGDRSSLNDDAVEILNNLLGTLKKDGQVIQIYSYTDSQGGDSYNTRLAERRLKSLLSYLHVKGIAQDKVSTQVLGVNDPAATNLTMEGRRLNNRVEIRIKP